ncbi:extensin-like [Bufo bufo]|uniref:extensin-like n=1 Tax=Bufo bufo TaxID=8384 RepID=UPI001ABEDDE4|nr:extensin-like [Bufo bufo]
MRRKFGTDTRKHQRQTPLWAPLPPGLANQPPQPPVAKKVQKPKGAQTAAGDAPVPEPAPTTKDKILANISLAKFSEPILGKQTPPQEHIKPQSSPYLAVPGWSAQRPQILRKLPLMIQQKTKPAPQQAADTRARHPQVQSPDPLHPLPGPAPQAPHYQSQGEQRKSAPPGGTAPVPPGQRKMLNSRLQPERRSVSHQQGRRKTLQAWSQCRHRSASPQLPATQIYSPRYR